MTYSEKVATGLCTYRTCHAPHGIGRMCEGHAEIRRVYFAARARRVYYEKKSLSLCVSNGCKDAATESTVYCTFHYLAHEEDRRKYRRTRAGKASNRRANRRWRRSRKTMGLCLRCNEPCVTKLYCETHRDEMNKEDRARREKRGQRVGDGRCRACDGTGHNSATCKQRGASLIPPLEAYATARSGSLLDGAG